MTIPSGKDHVIILRSTTDFGQKGLSMSFLGKQRPLSDSEFIDKARTTQKHTMSEGLFQQYLINDQGAVFLLTNDHAQKGFKVTLTFPGMKNGKIDGATGNSKQVELRASGGKAEIFIRPAEAGKELSITKISSSL